MPKTTTPLPQLISDRVRTALGRVESQIWTDPVNLDVKIGPLNKSFIGVKQAKKQQMRPIKPGEYFAQRGWAQRWFKINIPPAKKGEKGRRHLHWHSSGETTVYIDDKPWAGLDVAHVSCILPDKACALWLDTGTYQTMIEPVRNESYKIDLHGCKFDYAFIGLRNESAWEVYHDLFTLRQLAVYHLKKIDRYQRGTEHHLPIGDCPPLLRRILKRLDDSIDLYDARGLTALSKSLRSIYRDFPAESWNPSMGFTGHSHLDLVWLWPENITYRKAVHTYATILRLMERYPEMIFSASQPVLLHKIKTMVPSQYREVIKRVREGRWEMTGGLEVECDNQIPSGEALARAVAYGQERFRELRGEYTDTGWLPDVFGYNQYLPQIFALGGVKSFYTTKMDWSAITKFPHHSFVWKGPDGTEILTHLSASGNYLAQATVSETIGTMDRYRQSDVHEETLTAIGFGDGAGGLSEAHCERVRRMKNLATIPKSAWTGAEDFFKRLEIVRDELPVYQGELYLEYHRGTYTTQSRFKYYYRLAERALQTIEAVRVVLGRESAERDHWLRVIFSQFHDAIPGSSIKDVYDDMVPELEGIGTTVLEAAHREFKGRSRKKGIAVFNPLALPMSATVEIPVPEDAKSKTAIVLDNTGHKVPHQFTGRGKNRKALVSVRLDGLESRFLTFKNRTSPISEDGIFASEKRLSNGPVDALFDDNGQLTSLTIAGEDMQLAGKPGFMLHEDNPAMFDAWDIDHSSTWLGRKACEKMKLKLVMKGPVRAVLRGESALGEDSRLVVEYSLDRMSASLKVDVEVDWKESHKLLRYTVPTDYKGTIARYGCPFGSIDRNQKAGLQADEAQWEVPGSRWMAVLNGQGQGLSIVTEAKYGFSCRDGVAGLSLLRSPKRPDPSADMGKHRISFAIGKYSALTQDHDLSTAAEADAIFTKPITSVGASLKEIPFKLSNLGGMVPSWVLPAEKGRGYIIRLHDTVGANDCFDMEFTKAPAKVFMVDFLERSVEGRIKKVDDRNYRVFYRQNQILSVKVEPAQ